MRAMLSSCLKFAWPQISIVLLFVLYPEITIAQQQSSRPSASERIWSIFRQPGRNGLPSTTGRGAGSREGCPETEDDLFAIVPMADAAKNYSTFLETFTDSAPTLYFYVPYTTGLDITAEINIDFNESSIYQEQIPLQSEPGIIPVQVSADFQPGENYRWTFSIICNANNISQTLSVSGWMEKIDVPVALGNNPGLPTAEALFELYLENQLWFNMVEQLYVLQELNTDPTYQSIWIDLLCHTGLSSHAVTTIIGSPHLCELQ